VSHSTRRHGDGAAKLADIVDDAALVLNRCDASPQICVLVEPVNRTTSRTHGGQCVEGRDLPLFQTLSDRNVNSCARQWCQSPFAHPLTAGILHSRRTSCPRHVFDDGPAAIPIARRVMSSCLPI
jgi:hypothetical protein